MPYREDKYKRVQSIANIGGRTKQSFAFDSDPNRLMKAFNKTGDLDILKQTKAIAMHGDFSEVPDFFTALLHVQAVEEEFLAMPSTIRNHVDNDVSKLIDLLADPSRVQEAIDLGLVEGESTQPLSIPTAPDPQDPTPETPPDQ